MYQKKFQTCDTLDLTFLDIFDVEKTVKKSRVSNNMREFSKRNLLNLPNLAKIQNLYIYFFKFKFNFNLVNFATTYHFLNSIFGA